MYTKQDVDNYARKLIESMADMVADMAADPDSGFELDNPDQTEAVRDYAINYGSDVLDEFKEEVLRSISKMKFKAEIKMTVDF